MARKDTEVNVSFEYSYKYELTYKTPKNLDSIMKGLVEEVSETLEKLRLQKNMSHETSSGFLKINDVNNAEILKTLKVENINDTVELKKSVDSILGTFDASDQALCFTINNFPSSFDEEEAVDLPIDNSKKNSAMDGDEDVDVEEHYVGLVNQAMTCYLNSLLQALYMTPEFRNALYNWEYIGSENDEEALSVPFQLQKLFLNLQQTSYKSSVATNSLTESLGWDPSEAWQQHDVQEFCRVMFDTLEQKLKNTEQADLIHRLYEGKIRDYIKCLNCNTVKSREDTFLTIPLSVRPFDANETCGSVEEALKAFVKYETLEGNNQYFCQKCYKKTDAQKILKFTKFPYILMLQLKRFDFNQNTNRRRKLNDKVTFPEVLNLDSFIESTSNSESPSLEEDAGLCIKCDDSCITDSSIMDEEYAPSTPMDSNNHFTDHDQLEDEGIVMNNDIFQSHSSLNQDHEELQKKYIYELFSIMIHSGNARSGHYYAYIKDFRTGKWLCFNDQKVTYITSEDIEKTYGGGSKSVYCARSSTNAYMLMYRQIDPECNHLPMTAEDFPVHIKELVEKMKNEDNSPIFSHHQNLIKPIYSEISSIDLMKSANDSRHVTFADIDENGCESGSEEAMKSDKDERKTKSKKKMKEDKKAVKVGAASRKKASGSLTTKENKTSSETKAKVQTKKKIQAKRTDKKVCDSSSDSKIETSAETKANVQTKKKIQAKRTDKKVCDSSSDSKKNETSAETKANVQTKKKIQAKRTDKQVRDSGNNSSSKVLRSRNRTSCKVKLRISSGNPMPLRRSAYMLRTKTRDYYSFGSDDSPQTARNISKSPTTK